MDKMIDLIRLISKEEIKVDSNKIVCEFEPENTNIFL